MKRVRSTGAMNKRQNRRRVLLLENGCEPCDIDGLTARDFDDEDCENVGGELHHMNLDGKAGQRRLGHDQSYVMCRWHHQGVAPKGYTIASATERFGPSLKWNSRDFRERYGDDDTLLARANGRIGNAFCA